RAPSSTPWPSKHLISQKKMWGNLRVRYRSSLKSGGYNFAFFDVEALRPVTLHDPLLVAAVTLNTIAFCKS
ncbi:hypothetical protein ACFFJ4_22120, partial [Xanthomonas dyei]